VAGVEKGEIEESKGNVLKQGRI